MAYLTALVLGLFVAYMGGWFVGLIEGSMAVLLLSAVAGVVWVVGALPFEAWLSQWVWIGLVPATLALGLGALLRRWLPDQVFIYILGRGFLGTAVCIFLSGVMYELLYHLVGGVAVEQALVARWLMAWGDAFLTGLFTAIFVAFKPEWLATWSDDRYLAPPPPPAATVAPGAAHPATPPSAITPPDDI